VTLRLEVRNHVIGCSIRHYRYVSDFAGLPLGIHLSTAAGFRPHSVVNRGHRGLLRQGFLPCHEFFLQSFYKLKGADGLVVDRHVWYGDREGAILTIKELIDCLEDGRSRVLPEVFSRVLQVP